MSSHSPDKIRNIAIVGHSGTGKTSVTESIAFSAGVTNRLGTVDDGTTISDFTDAEKERKISIAASLVHCNWKGTKVNVVDAPGYADFIGDAKAALWAADNAVITVHAQSGVEVGTDKAWGFSEEFGRPVMFLANHLDKEQADFDSTLAALQEHFGNGVAPLQIPVNPGAGFNAIVDILHRKLHIYATDGSGKSETGEVPGDMAEQVASIREQLVEAIAEGDDELLEKYLENGELSEDDIARGLKSGISSRSVFPVLCSDASRNIGIDILLDFLDAEMPSPKDVELLKGTSLGGDEISLMADPAGPLVSIVFKTISESAGDLTFVRVLSGDLKAGQDTLNATLKSTERVGQTYYLCGQNRSDTDSIGPGDMGALMKLKDTHTGNSLTTKVNGAQVIPIAFPEPLIRIAVEPKARGDEDKIGTGLQKIHEEDPSFLSGYNPELKQIIVEGQGELHLTVVLGKLKQKFGVDVNTIEPRIPYRETIIGRAEGHHRHKKQSGGRGQFGEVYLRIEPKGRGDGYEFEDAVVGGNIPRNFIPAVEKGIVETLEVGPVAGYQVVDTKVTVYDGSYHPVDSSEMAFKMAGSNAFQKAFLDAKPILLEPIYQVNVKLPEQYMGEVMGDLNSRRGRIQGMDPEANFQVVRAEVPLAELYKYSTTLRSITQGTGDYTMSMSHFEQVPQDVMGKIVAESKQGAEAVEA
ncbi:MAG: elongation factor G [Candidatus Latescibacterota bacterium]|nr:elongation factor G [Candidatus Latescibacterota bacterium]